MRVLAVLANTLLFFFANPSLKLFGNRLTIFDVVGLAIALILFIVFIVSSYTQARELSRVDPQKR
jgi:hypothetical protein